MDIEKYLLKFVNTFKLKKKEIAREDGEKYLTRYYIYRKSNKWLPSIYLHCIHTSDYDIETHSHPWQISLSIILSNYYKEERLNALGEIECKIYGPGNINFIRSTDFHRLDLNNGRVWTLFISGAKTKSWGFKDRVTQQYWDYKEFFKLKGYEPSKEDDE